MSRRARPSSAASSSAATRTFGSAPSCAATSTTFASATTRNVQDTAVIHVDADAPCTIGNGVTIGHGATVHGCTVGDFSLIGIGATILSHAVIGKYCLVGAGALITERKVFADRSLIIGAPARRAARAHGRRMPRARSERRELRRARQAVSARARRTHMSRASAEAPAHQRGAKSLRGGPTPEVPKTSARRRCGRLVALFTLLVAGPTLAQLEARADSFRALHSASGVVRRGRAATPQHVLHR